MNASRATTGPEELQELPRVSHLGVLLGHKLPPASSAEVERQPLQRASPLWSLSCLLSDSCLEFFALSSFHNSQDMFHFLLVSVVEVIDSGFAFREVCWNPGRCGGYIRRPDATLGHLSTASFTLSLAPPPHRLHRV